MNEGLFLCQLAADKSGQDVMKLAPHNINLYCSWPGAELYILLPLSLIDLLSSHPSLCNSSRAFWWGAVPVHQSAVETQRTPCDRGNLWRSVLDNIIISVECHTYFRGPYGLIYMNKEVRVSIYILNMWLAQLPHLACRSGVHRAAWSHAAEHGAKLHLVALIRDLHYPLEPHIPLLWTGIHSGPWGHLP